MTGALTAETQRHEKLDPDIRKRYLAKRAAR